MYKPVWQFYVNEEPLIVKHASNERACTKRSLDADHCTWLLTTCSVDTYLYDDRSCNTALWRFMFFNKKSIRIKRIDFSFVLFSYNNLINHILFKWSFVSIKTKAHLNKYDILNYYHPICFKYSSHHEVHIFMLVYGFCSLY